MSISKKKSKNIKILSQLKGIDLIVTTDKEVFKIDEKAQLYYINNPLPTFAFELQFLNRNSEVSEGWLINSNLENDYYMLIWPSAKHSDLSLITKDDFSQIECLLIKKSEILNFLERKGWTTEKIKNEIDTIHSHNQFGRINIPNERDFFFYHSSPDKYIEQPINLVVYKKVLLKLSRHHYIITKNSRVVKK
ncbi:MAG: hypothetical protein ACRCTS_02835 [Fusobacteriaceae bacterium]